MISAVDSDLQIKRGPAHRDTLPPPSTVSEEGGSKKPFFRPYGPQFGLKIREPGPPGLDLPLDLTPLFQSFLLGFVLSYLFFTKCDKTPTAICK